MKCMSNSEKRKNVGLNVLSVNTEDSSVKLKTGVSSLEPMQRCP